MRSVYRAITAAICAFLTGCAVAQGVSTNGTMLADDLTSSSRVVVDAFANSSNKVYELIQNVSPTPDFTTNNQTLVDTIVDVSSEPYLSDFVLKSELTNDVCAIVTNENWSGWTYEGLPDGANILTSPEPQETSWFFSFALNHEVYLGTGYYSTYPSNSNRVVFYNCYTPLSTNLYNVTATRYRKNTLGLVTDNRFYSTITGEVSGIVTNVSADWSCNLGNLAKKSSNFWRGYWEGVFIELRYGAPYWTITSDGGFGLTETVEGSADATYLRFEVDEGSEAATALGTTSIELVRGNALGLARMSDVAPTVSNTVTKAYVEDLGIESGVDAQTVTNMTALAPVYSHTPTFSDEWTISPSGKFTEVLWGDGEWLLSFDDYPIYTHNHDPNATSVSAEDYDGTIYTATRVRTDVIGYTLGAQTNSVLAATNGLVTASITNGLIGSDYIATNNAAFVAAVTNCPVVIASADSEALTEWGIYSGGGTIGALLAALAAAVAALKKKKMPLYPIGGTVNPVNATIESGVLTVSPFSRASYTPTANAAFSVAMGALPSDMEEGKVRDAVLMIDCTSLTEGQEPTVTWGTHFHPRTDTATDLAIVEAGKRAVFYISEYAAGEFAVGGWVETDGGNA